MTKIIYSLNYKLRKKLSRPLGKVFSQDKVLEILKNQTYPIIVIGDETGIFLKKNDIVPSIWIYDGKIRRRKIKGRVPFPDYIVKNPRSVITEELCKSIDDSLKLISKKRNIRIFVIGEEDLATLYVLSKAKKAFILYGQPNEGIVIIKSNEKIRKKAKEILEEMKI